MVDEWQYNTLCKVIEDQTLRCQKVCSVCLPNQERWQDRDYATIIAVAEKIPNNVLEEDPKLLMWYDQAITRMGEE
ncbi:MAG: hypothetical protein WBP54_06740 [Pelodictyon phaeoclathratiforme]